MRRRRIATPRIGRSGSKSSFITKYGTLSRSGFTTIEKLTETGNTAYAVQNDFNSGEGRWCVQRFRKYRDPRRKSGSLIYGHECLQMMADGRR